jgi:uncharacterized protein YwgA
MVLAFSQISFAPVKSTGTICMSNSNSTASDFLSSLGVNTHGGDYLDAYDNSSLIIESLKYIGISKVRDAYSTYGQASPVLDAMADAGITFDFRVRSTTAVAGTAALTQYVTDLKAFVAEHPGSVVSIEGLNEVNLDPNLSYKGLTGAAAGAAFQQDLYQAIKADPVLSHIAVVNLSVGDNSSADYATVGDLGAYSDYANAHVYTVAGGSADPQMEYAIGLAKNAASGDPLVITETGSTTLQSWAGVGASETAQAKLILTNLLDAYEDGSVSTYLYELFDTPSVAATRGEAEAHFGLFNADGTPKLAAVALHNLTTILSSGDSGGATATSFNYSLSGAPSQTHSMLLAKSGGVEDLVVWADKQVWNDTTDSDITNPTANVTVTLDHVEPLVYVYDPLSGLTPIAVYKNVSSFKIPVSDHPLVVEFGATGAVQEETETVSPDLTMTAAEFVAQMTDLKDASGLQSVTLSDTHTLAVSSVETMKYLVAHYGSLLGKISGGYNFSVTYGQDSWTKVQNFDAAGNLTLCTEYGLSNGVIMSKTLYYPDGSTDIYAYNITGQAYTSTHQTTDVKGNVTLVERFHGDGTYDLRDVRGTDGSRDTAYYNSAGKMTTDVQLASDGTNTTITYDTTTGYATRQVVKATNGDVLTTVYTNGIKSSYVQASHLGSTETITYDTSTGKMLTDYTAYSDGSAVMKKYSAGILVGQNVRNADGSTDNYAYNIAGQTYTSTHQATNAAGGITLIERFHADGTYDYRELRASDGSRDIANYNSVGKMTTDVKIAADGTNTTITYDTAIGYATRQVVKAINGDVLTTVYTGGIKSSYVQANHLGWTETTTYDPATSKVLTDYTAYSDGSAVMKKYISGVLASQNVRNADGSTDNYAYNITGQTYTSTHQAANAAGSITLIERFHADGTYDYRETRGTDGSKDIASYNSAGKMTTDVKISGDGTNTTTTYNTTTACATQQVVTQTNGDILTTLYTNGIKSSYVQASHLGSTETITYDTTTGAILTDYTAYSDGSAVMKKYSAGVLASQNVFNADGSTDNYAYNITGQTYTSTHQATNAAGSITLIERFHADGTYDYRETRGTDGSKDIASYNSAGKMTTDVKISGDGTNTTTTYNTTTACATQQVVTQTNGDVLTTLYTSGIKSSYVQASHLGSTETTTYDTTTGKILTDYTAYSDGSAVMKKYIAGVLASQNVRNADGSTDNYVYNITSQSYTSTHQAANAAGSITLIERFHADGTYDYRETRAADGSRVIDNYNSLGKMTTDVKIAGDGTNTTTTYNITTGYATQQVVKETDGDVLTTLYTSGIKSSYVQASHLGWTETTTYDTSTGKMLTDYTINSDGSAVMKSYTAGVLMKQNVVNADHSTDNYAYNITGQTYTSTHQANNAAGSITAIERFHADGTYDYHETRAADGSKVIDNYTSSGSMLNHSAIASDGSRTVDYYLQDGSGTMREDRLNSSLVVLTSDTRLASGTHTIYDYADAQTLSGGSLSDTFYFRGMKSATLNYQGGNDTIYNLDLTTSTHGHIDIHPVFATQFSDLHMAQVGADVVITFDSHDSITLKATQLASVTADDFIFG